MVFKVAIIFVLIFVLLHLASAGVSRPARDVQETVSDVGSKIGDAATKAKEGIEDFVQQVKDSEFVQQVSDSVGKMAQSVKETGQELVQKIQTAASN